MSVATNCLNREGLEPKATDITCSHTTCSHTTCTHTTCTHTTYSHTTDSHTTYSHTTYSRTTHMDHPFAWHAWHLWHWTGDALCKGESRGTPRLLAWQAWHTCTHMTCTHTQPRTQLTWIVALRGRHGTYDPPARIPEITYSARPNRDKTIHCQRKRSGISTSPTPCERLRFVCSFVVFAVLLPCPSGTSVLFCKESRI